MSKLAPGTYVTGKEYRTADGECVEIVAPEGFVGAVLVRREPVPLDGTPGRYWRPVVSLEDVLNDTDDRRLAMQHAISDRLNAGGA